MTRRAFTFVEMCIAMTITAMTGLAIFAFASATTRTWSATEHVHQLEISAIQSQTLLTNIVERSRALALVSDSPPMVFLWLTDSYDGTADGKAQFAEMAVLEYDTSTASLVFYQADMSAAQTARVEAAEVLSTGDMSNSDFVTMFRKMTWLAPGRALLGPGRSLDLTREITRVEAVSLTPVTSAGLPAFEMNVTLSRGRETKQTSSVFVVRAPTARPDYAGLND